MHDLPLMLGFSWKMPPSRTIIHCNLVLLLSPFIRFFTWNLVREKQKNHKRSNGVRRSVWKRIRATASRCEAALEKKCARTLVYFLRGKFKCSTTISYDKIQNISYKILTSRWMTLQRITKNNQQHSNDKIFQLKNQI